MSGIPNNIVSILAVDNAGATTVIDVASFITSIQPVTTSTTPVFAQPIVQKQSSPAPVVTTITTQFDIEADANYITKVNKDKTNIINSVLYENNKKIGLNIITPNHLFDVYGGSLNVTPMTKFDGYKLKNINFAYPDFSTATKETIIIGDDSLLPRVSIYTLLLRGLITTTSPTTPRVLSVDDTGLVSTLSLTSGSVIFSNGVGLVQDNNTFFWDNTNKRLGIGNKVPTEALHVTGSIRQSAVTSAMLKADSTGKIVAAVAGTDYQASLAYTPANAATTITINGTTQSLAANRTWSVGTVTDVAALTIVSTGVDITSTILTGTTTPVITLSVPTASATARGALSSTDWTTFNNKQAALSGTGFVKSTAGVISYDTATYYLASNPSGYISGNQSITLSGDVSGTGTTAITTTLATITQAATGSFVKVTLDTKGRVIGNTAVTASDITTALTYTPVTNARTLTINGTTYDLTANRSWTIDIGSNVRNVVKYTATAGQTTFTVTGGYTVGVIDVYLNGAKLTGTDYTASNGTTVVLAAGVVAGDIIETVAYTSYAASSISGAGTTGYLTKWTGSSSQGNSIIQDSGSAITVGGSVAATSFSGAGTGLTGTASGLSIGGSAASITGIYGGSITSLQVTNGLGYTPYNATNPSGYITGITSSNVTTALGYTPYNSSNPSGYITGITSGNVITALGYTPYNATNPNGYITGITSGNVTTALGYTPYNATNPAGYITSSASITGTSSNITAYTINQNVGTSNSPTFAGQTINGGGQLIRSSSSNTGGSRTINHCKVASTASFIYAIQVTGLTSKLINWVCYFGSNDAYLGYSAYQIIAAGIVWFNSSGVAFDQGSNWTYQAGSGNNGILQFSFNPSGYANSLVFGSNNSTGAGGLTTNYHIVFYGDGVNSMTINYL